MQAFERHISDEPATRLRLGAGIDGALPTPPPTSAAETTVDVFREELLRARSSASGDDLRTRADEPLEVGVRFDIGENRDGMVVVRPEGEIELATRTQLRDTLEAFHGDVELDMSAVSFLDSSGIGALMLQRVRLEALGHALHITNATRAVRDPLTLVGLGDWLE